MRQIVSLSALGVAALLTGCGGGGGSNQSTATYSIGGSVSGLSGSVTLLNDGSDQLSLSSNGPFTFSAVLQAGLPYDVTIEAQPAGEICSVSNGSGTVSAAVTNVAVVCSPGSAITGEWTWQTGSNAAGAAGIYGNPGTAGAANTPGARKLATAWTDASGNFWLFGGYGADVKDDAGMLNDLWKYTAGQWTWEGGADTEGAPASYGAQAGTPGGNPGAREGASEWTDGSGDLWLFGGDSLNSSGDSEEFNDLWEYDTTSEQWTWVGGSSTADDTAGNYGMLGMAAPSNLPPARTDAITWTDSSGIFWLFGGAQFSPSGAVAAVYNDLWSYNPNTMEWTWVGGSQGTNAAGVYGTQGTPAASNVPGARMGGNAWVDGSGNVWLFGGLALQGGSTVEYNDLWSYNPNAMEWTWVGGSQSANADGVYGTAGIGAAGDGPGARVTAVSWRDSSGNFWLFGGFGYDDLSDSGDLSDLWQYNPGTGVWTWVSGSSSAGTAGAYGTQGTPSNSAFPGGREQAVGWLDGSGNLWLFGGVGYDGAGEQNFLNDLWSFTPTP